MGWATSSSHVPRKCSFQESLPKEELQGHVTLGKHTKSIKKHPKAVEASRNSWLTHFHSMVMFDIKVTIFSQMVFPNGFSYMFIAWWIVPWFFVCLPMPWIHGLGFGQQLRRGGDNASRGLRLRQDLGGWEVKLWNSSIFLVIPHTIRFFTTENEDLTRESGDFSWHLTWFKVAKS